MLHQDRNYSKDSSQENINEVESNTPTEQIKTREQELQKMNVNPNPRANENVKNTPFKKEKKETGVGSEITDGEAG